MNTSLLSTATKNLFALAAIFALCGGTALAKTLDFPGKGETLFQITIPDSWEPEEDDDDVLAAESPKENISLTAWALNTSEDIENVGKDIVDTLQDYATKIKIDGNPQKVQPGGMDGLLFKGDAVDKQDSHAIDFFALLVANKGKVAVVLIQANADTPEPEANKLVEILKSITPPSERRLLRAGLAPDEKSPATTSFTTETPKICAFFAGEALEVGDVVKGVWIAEDVGDAAPKNSLIDHALTLTAKSPTDTGAFTLSRPNNGWPVGVYRVELYVNDKLAETVRFTISAE